MPKTRAWKLFSTRELTILADALEDVEILEAEFMADEIAEELENRAG
jgi:hypothetical protein